MSHQRAKLTDRLDAERFTLSLIHAMGTKQGRYVPSYKSVIRQRLEDERAVRIKAHMQSILS